MSQPAAGVWSDLVGQQATVAVLQRASAAAAATRRGEQVTGMTHAWLFTGPPGSGLDELLTAVTSGEEQRQCHERETSHGGAPCFGLVGTTAIGPWFDRDDIL